jgi:hypothetical protein
MLDGPPVVTTGDACGLVSTLRYQVTNSAHRILDPRTALVVKDGGVAVPIANIALIDYLFGRVTFAAGHAPSGAVTIDGAFIPTLPFLLGNDLQFSAKRTVLPSTVFGSSFAQKLAGLMDADLTIKSLASPNDDYDTGTGGTQSLWADFTAGTPKLINIDMDGSGTSGVIRGWFQLSGLPKTAPVAGIQEMTVSGTLAPLAPSMPASTQYGVSFMVDTP